MHQDLDTILFSEQTIHLRLDELAAEITRDFAGKELTVVAILHGSLPFVADLLRRVPLPLKVECISVSSYHGGTESSGTVTLNQLELPDLSGEHVLMLDDILDTGRTLDAIGRKLAEVCSPKSLKICVLLDKKTTRAVEVHADYVGFEIGDEFVVGYGLDFRGHYRNLPCVGILKKELIG